MVSPVLLNNVDHKDLRIITEHSARYNDNVMLVPTYPAEFRSLQAHYPILFHKAQGADQYVPVAALGFEQNENLFLKDGRWDATYIPLAVQRQPFFIGRQPATDGGEPGMVIQIDKDSPRLSTSEGERVFLEHGGNSEFLERINSILSAMHEGMRTNGIFVETLLKHNLLESFVLDVELNNGDKHRLAGFHTIREERLNELDGDVLHELQRSGALAAIYMVIASLSNFRDLIERKNSQLANDATGAAS